MFDNLSANMSHSLDSRYSSLNNFERASTVRSIDQRQKRRLPLDSGLSIIILTKNKPEFIIPLTQQIQTAAISLAEANAPLEIECLIGDTGSSDSKVLSHYAELPRNVFRIFSDLSYHFSQNNNLLARRARFETLCFCNNDIIFDDPTTYFLESYKSFQTLPTGSILGQQLLFEDGSIQHAGVFFSPNSSSWALPYHPGAAEKPQLNTTTLEVPAVTGALLTVSASDFEKLGGFDEAYEAECQDADLCLKASRMNQKCFLQRRHKVTHFENGTRRTGEESLSDRSKFLRQWQSYLEVEYLG